MNIISEALRNLVTWTQVPDPDTLAKLLAAMTDGDLMVAMTHMKNDPAGRIAWAEYGRRHGYVDFQISAVVSEGRLTVRFEGDAKPVHHGAIFEVKA